MIGNDGVLDFEAVAVNDGVAELLVDLEDGVDEIDGLGV